MSFKTPRPVPKFYSNATKETTFSTKREKNTPFAANVSLRPVAGKTAPAATRFYNHRFDAQKPTFVTYRSQSDSFLEMLSIHQHYDESCTETYFDQCFEIIAKIGEGSFGEVFSVRSKEDGCMYAIKRSMEGFRNEWDRTLKLTEVLKHQQLPKQANLVRLYRAWEERGRLYIQQELCRCSLADYSAQNGPMDERTLWNVFVDLLLAVKHLHDHNLIHLDIKPDNIFISDDGICKLGDFGLVCDLKKERAEDASEGDAKYMAPELLSHAPTKAADIFSLGMSMLELATDMDVPTRGPSWHVLRSNRMPDDLMNQASLTAPLRHAIQSMMTADARLRPCADQLLRMSAVPAVLYRRKLYHAWRSAWTSTREMLFTVYLFVFTLIIFLWEHIIVGSAAFVLNRTGIAGRCANAVSCGLSRAQQGSVQQQPGGSAGRKRATPSNTPVQHERLVMRLQFDDDDQEGARVEPLARSDTQVDWIYSPPASPHVQHHRSRVLSPISAHQSPSDHHSHNHQMSPPPLSQSEFAAFQPHRLFMVADDTSDDSSDDMGMPMYRPQPLSPSSQPRVSTPAQKRNTSTNRQRMARTHDDRLTRRSKKIGRADNSINQSFCAFGDQHQSSSPVLSDYSGSVGHSAKRAQRARPVASAAIGGAQVRTRRAMLLLNGGGGGCGDSPVQSYSTSQQTRPARQITAMFEQQPGSSSADEL